MGKKKGKKSGGEKEEQATGGKNGRKSVSKEEGGGEQQVVPSEHKHQKKKTPAQGLGVDVTAGPSQQPPAHVPEPRPTEPPPATTQAPQVWGKKKGPPEVMPPQAMPHKTRDPGPPSGQPPPRVKGPGDQPQHVVEPVGTAPGFVGVKGPVPSQEVSLVAPGGKGPRGATPQPPSQAPSSAPAPTGAVKKSGTDPGVAAITKGMKSLQIPVRKECGTVGRRTVVETNHLSLDLSKLRNKVAYHYDVEFDPPLPKRLLRHAMEEFRRKHFPDRHPAFDGRRNLYSSHILPQRSDCVMVHDDESLKDKEFKVTLQLAVQIDLEPLMTYMRSGTSLVPPQTAIQALDVVLRSAPMAFGFVPVGRSFFTPPRGEVVQLGDGLEMWYGIFQSAILGWKPFVNIDVAHKGFPKAQNVVDAMNEICGSPREGNELHYTQKEDFMRFIRGLKVEYMLPNNPSSKRTYRVNNIAECPAKLRFKLENNRQVTVQDYFLHKKNVTLKHPYLPCLHVGSMTRETPIYLPSELCWVVKSQVVNKKMNEKQTSAMIKNAATSTEVRKRKIMEALRAVRFNEDPCVQEFGISVGGKFEEVEARILDAPQLEYNKQKPFAPRAGVWRPLNFYSGGNLKSWMVLNLDRYTRDDALRRFGEEMQRMGKSLGMDIGPPSSPHSMREPGRDTRELEEFFKTVKTKKIDMVVVVVPDRGNSYAKVKQVAELTVGVLTQCLKARTMQRMNPSTCSNILLKVNSKLNGVNHALAAVSKPPCLRRPVMIVGADVTHPAPDQTDIPSVAAVCASHDPQAFKYNIQIRLQPPRVEIIQDLEVIMREQLKYFYGITGYKPERIIFYRDGVSEGQFFEVLNNEVNAIRRACISLNPEYKPKVTFLVVQKRHHTRFFPTKKEDEDGKNHNVPPGTVVDRTITHPIELDFFLVSHASIQGVSRPTKYHLLWNDDDKMTTDELEQLTYYLCHMFSRCTRSVSYPAPTYNAHLAAYRARVYLEGRPTINVRNLQHEQKVYFEGSVLKSIMKDSPMYFV